MPITAQYAPITSPSAGDVAPIPVTWPFSAPNDIVVNERTTATGAEILTVSGVDYTVTMTPTGGTVNPLRLRPVGTSWIVSRATAMTQPSSLRNGGPYNPETVENVLNRTTLQVQEIREDVPVFPAERNRTAGAPLAFNGVGEVVNGSAIGTGDLALRGDLVATGSGKGSNLMSTQQSGAGSVSRTVTAKLAEQISVLDFGAVGDGVTNDQTKFNNALALGVPVLVPYTASHYVLTTLTEANRALLWGPGRVKVGGVDVNISSDPRAFGNTQASHSANKPAWQPAQFSGVQGSIGNGSTDDDLTRTGGFGTYGMALKRLHVTAAVPAGQFDVGDTTWVGATNLTGGQVFAGWHGANTPARYLGGVYSGGAAIGHEINVGNRWADFGLQTDVGGTRYTVGQQIVADVIPAKDGDNVTAVSGITIASPGVATVTAHGFVAGMGFVLTGAGAVPTGLVKDTTYYVLATGITADTFRFAASPGGAAINTTGSFVAPINVRPSWAGSFGTVHGASVHGHRWWVGTLIRSNTIMPGGYGHYESGGSVADQAPAAWTKVVGYWQRGLDMRGVAFTNYAVDLQSASYVSGSPFNFDFTANHASTAGTGGVALPGGAQGFLRFHMNGSPIKVAYYPDV